MTKLQQLRAICDAATPGPWNAACESGDWFVTMAEYHALPFEDEEANTQYIATFNPALISKLLDLWEVELLRKGDRTPCIADKLAELEK